MDKILEVKNLRKTFYKSRSPFPAVEDVSFQLMRGECLGLVGGKRLRKKYHGQAYRRTAGTGQGKRAFRG